MATTRKVTAVRFENDRALATFFCVVQLDGKKVQSVVGNTRKTDGEITISQRTGERYPTEAQAELAFEQLVQARTKNYKTPPKRTVEEVAAAKFDGLAPAMDNRELEAQVIAARGTAQAREVATVYADWLHAHGDVRGELAALDLAGKERVVEAKRVALATALFGELDVKLDTDVRDLTWTDGFLEEASLRRGDYQSKTQLDALTAAFLDLPVTSVLTGLRFGLASAESDNDWTSTVAAVVASRRAAQIRRLRFDDYTSEDCEISWTPGGDLSAAWSLPALRELTVRAGGDTSTLGEIVAPELVAFARVTGGMRAAELEEILAAHWPKLESLELWIGRSDYGAEVTAAMLMPLLDGRKAPAGLRHLGIANSEIAHELIEPLARAPFLPRLKTLDLSKGALLDRDVDALVRHADAFGHLQWLDLSENLLSDRVDDVRAALPNAVLDDQRDVDDDRRYAAVGE